MARELSHTQHFYLTGDLVRYDSDGSMIYVGRKDTQVKIHGQRVELGEIEHHLLRGLPVGTGIAVDMVRPDCRPGTKLLVAFISLHHTDAEESPGEILWSMLSDLRLSASRIQSQLAHELPAYMIPSVYIPIRAIPLTSSRKTDRHRLRQVASALTEAELATLDGYIKSDRRVPARAMDIRMQRLWIEVLDLKDDAIGLDDNFFRVGGDSLNAIRLVAAARADHFSLTVASIFQSPTLEGMSNATTMLDKEDNEPPAPFTLLVKKERARLIREVTALCRVTEDMTLEDIYPCTALQEGLMVFSIKQPGVYVGQNVMRLSRDIDIQRFQAAWESVVQSTPILRTRVVQTESHGCLQAVVRSNIEWSTSTDLQSYLQEDKENTFYFGSSLSRLALIKEQSRDSDVIYFVWTCHHSIFDGWYLPRILASVERIYQESEILIASDIQAGIRAFNHFVKYISELDKQEIEAFWRSQFIDFIPSAFPHSPGRRQLLANATLIKDISLVRPAASSITIPTLIRAAWALIVARYSGTDDIVFGATLTGRNALISGIEEIFGPTIATVPVRAKLDDEQEVSMFLEQIQAQATAMIPYEQAGLQTIRRLSYEAQAACDFQNLLVIQPSIDFGQGDKASLFHNLDYTGDVWNFNTYPLTMECTLTSSGVRVNAMFHSTILDTKQMERVICQFGHILQQLSMIHPQARVRDIERISPQDMSEILDWNSAIPETINRCVHDLIDEQIQAQPEELAICSWDGELTYSALDGLSSRLASYLVGLGVGPEVLVPLCFEKSMWTVVAMLGVLKAGGAFVPLDPSHPKQRLITIMNDLNADFLLSSEKYHNLGKELCHCIVVNRSLFDMLPERDLSARYVSNSTDALYLIFTSGTTGSPKGVIIEHAAYCSGAKAQVEALQLTRSSRVLQFASYSFDTSIEEMLTTLIAGGCICVPSEEDRLNNIEGAINRMRVNWADLTPSFLPLLAPEAVPDLSVLILGGEPLNTSNIRTWAQKSKLINAYGQTECCITSVVKPDVFIDTDPANIGRAVGGLCWITEPMDHHTLAPVGTVGELLIEGPILARGYLNRPEDTARVFIDDPSWMPKDGQHRRLYKTGDLVQYFSDGSIKYIGRKDTQIKIRGQRVELSEIEHHLRHCMRGCKDAAVSLVVPESGNKDPVLFAFISFGEASKVAGLKANDQLASILDEAVAELSRSLPKYMLPSVFIPLNHMPLTTSGKADRRVLNSLAIDKSGKIPRFNLEATSLQTCGVITHAEPLAMTISTEIARLMGDKDAQLPSALKGKDMVLSHVGLDSIAMIHLANIMRRSYGVQIGIQALYDSRMTVRGLAALVNGNHVGASKPKPSDKFDIVKEFNLVGEELDRSLSIPDARAKPGPRQVKRVFVTGGTGFLGSQILRQFLEQSDIETVIAHVRANTSEHGLQRIINAAKLGRWWTNSFLSKLQIWTGDLTQQRLGLTWEQWRCLSDSACSFGRIDTIVHNGAVVHWNLDYQTLKAANVMSTLELLKVTCQNDLTRFVYVSGGHHYSDDVSHDQKMWPQVELYDGYSQTKFISEHLVRRCIQKLNRPHQRVAIIKPGLIIGTVLEGVPNMDDFVWRVVAGAISVGGYDSADVNGWLSVSSADRVAAVISKSVTRAVEAKNSIYTIHDGVTVQEFWDVLVNDSHYDLRPMSHVAWLDAIRNIVEAKREAHPLWPVLHLLETSETSLGGEIPTLPIAQSRKDSVKSALKKNVEYLVDLGFLPNANGVQRPTKRDGVFGRHN